MTFSFINPVFLFLLPLIGIPLLLHLFARSKPPVFRFSSIDFIRRVQRQTMRIRKPHDYLLLLLRTLLITALLGLFLRPVLHLPGMTESNSGRSICLVVDNTASMGVTENGQTRLARACAEAAETLKKLNAKDRVNLVWMQADPQAVFPEVGSNIKPVLSALRQAKPGYETGNPAEALNRAANLLKNVPEGSKSLYVFSDFQRDQWEHLVWNAPVGIETVFIPIGHDRIPNTAITALECTPAQPLPGTPLTATAFLANFSDTPVQQTVYLSFGSTRRTQTAMLPANSRMPVSFHIKPSADQPMPLECAIDDDAFPFDNKRHMLIPPARKLQVGLYNADTETYTFWKRIVEALDWAEAVTITDLNAPGTPDVLLAAGWNGQDAADAIRQFLESGHSVIWYPASPLSTETLNLFFNADTSEYIFLDSLAAPSQLVIANPEHHLFDLFRNGQYGDPTRVRFSKRFTVPKSPLERVTSLLNYEDGTPALLEASDVPLFLWNMPVAPTLSNARQVEEFVILFAELLKQNLPVIQTSPNYPGTPLSWTPDAWVDTTSAALTDPNGKAIGITAHAAEHRYVSAPVNLPGIYSWSIKERVLNQQCVVFPEIESDLSPGAPETDETNAITVRDGFTVRKLRDGIELWPWFLAASLIIVFCELLLAWYAERTG